MSFRYKLVAFDLDGTLASSKGVITPEMGSLLSDLAKMAKIAVISGGSMTRFQEQLLVNLKPDKNIYLLPTEGSERFEFDGTKWNMVDREPFPRDLKEKSVKLLNELITSGLYDIPKKHSGEYIEDRDTELAFSALGQTASLEEKEKWDPDRSKREKIKDAMEKEIPGISATVSGTTSIDILPKGFDKARGLSFLMNNLKITSKDVLFIGDAITPGANDYSVFQAGIESVRVDGPSDTEMVIKELIKNGTVPVMKANLPEFPKNPIAFFCAEYALSDDPSMYAGGLGVLAGDYLYEIADQNYPFIAIGLKYGIGTTPDGFEILPGVIINVPIGKDFIKAKVWHRTLASNVHIMLLDAGEINKNLYDTDFYVRVRQQMVLGIGGVKLLTHLGIVPKIYHLNEGHTSFAALALAVEKSGELGKVVASKHTILSDAGMLIKNSDLEELIGPYCKEFGVKFKEIFERGKFELNTEMFSTTKLIMNTAVRKNGVSSLHVVYEKIRHPHSELIAITNGVYRKRWQAPELLNRSKAISDDEIWKIKRKLRLELFSYITKVSGHNLNPDICTIVWARRFAAYKRPFLLFSDQERLTEIISNQNLPLQIVISGKAHISDKEGQAVLQKIIDFSNKKEVLGRVVYIPNYCLSVAHELIQGADIWLNTPERGKEACGTSGMKAALNGALQCSIKDGWVDEVSLDGIGWSLPEENTADTLYDLLEHEILPCFYGESHQATPEKWVGRMKSTIDLVEKNYDTKRMFADYLEKLYLL